ncbi:MAG: hypothetical protein SGI92_20465 [Bryobacteraceae bacterium]|nr:hypothetical protein [Bryobacteraceae bacterium]
MLAAQVVRVRPGLPAVAEEVCQVDPEGAVVPRPIRFTAGDEELHLLIYTAGLRGSRSTAVRIGDQRLTPSCAGPQGSFAGLDQINIRLPHALAGTGAVPLVVEAEGGAGNTASLTFE